MWAAGRCWGWRERALLWGVLMATWEAAWGQLRYSVPEELPKGSFVGDVAKDMRLQLPALRDRGFRILDKGRTLYFALYGKTGHLVTAEIIDREQLCESVQQCVLRCEVIIEREMQIYEIEVDINDNSPSFREAEKELRMSEMTAPGWQFPLAEAHDPDSGPNSVQSYELSGDEHFSLAVQTGPGGDQRPELVLAKALDREEAAFHELEIFHLDAETGEISLVRSLDFEEGDSYEMEVQARDGGELFVTAKVEITVADVNDNAPELTISSALSEISEAAPPGTVVALLHVQDRDSGANGEVRCSLDGDVPFRLRSSRSSYYSVVTAEELDREQVSEYNVTVRPAAGGSPALWSSVVLGLRVLDVNDKAPVFEEARYSAYVAENNAAGALVLRMRAWDADWGQNARVRYRLGEGRVRGAPLSSSVSVEVETARCTRCARSTTRRCAKWSCGCGRRTAARRR
ncbi:hypothetical protein Q9966_001738 [Columba livia]|nr:hypothetical protein Q9966_001738 [Columba livia]